MSKKKLFLIDGSAYLFRAYHAMPSLTNSQGEPTGAIYGIVNMMRKLQADFSPEYIAVVFDAPGKTFRDDMYSEYKATRSKMPDELRSQIEHVHTVVKTLGYPFVMTPGVEADDVIGTLAVQATAKNFDTVIISGDKDLAQLVNKAVCMIDTMKDATYDEAGVKEKFGVAPDRIIDYLTLIGDTSDNIPGVPKVGPKTAVKWIDQYGSLDEIVTNADEIDGKVGENLRASLAQIPLSRDLVTVKLDVELEQSPENLKMGEPDEAALREQFARFEFKTWLRELGGSVASSPSKEEEIVAVNYETVLTTKELDAWIEKLKAADLFAFDTETTSLNSMQAELVGLSIAVTAGEAAYVPVAHDYDNAPKQLCRDDVLKKLKPLLEDPKYKKVGQNLKYDRSVLANYDIELNGIEYDTMLESYVLDSTATRHDMDSLALKYLGHKTVSYSEVAGSGKAQVTFNKVPLETAAHYAAEDADITLRLHEVLWPRLEKEERLKNLFQTIEMPLLTVLGRIERNGVKIDANMLAEQSHEFAKRIDQIEREAHDEAGQVFNIASPKQIQEILYDKLNLPVLKKTPKGQPSTAENVLQELAGDYAIVRLILEHRGLSKLKSTYTDKLPGMINPDTGRVHTSYHQAVAATGRLSSADPNLQNIPIRTAEGRRIREAFIPENGNKLIAADYSQIELRIMAHLSQDPGLLKAFTDGADVHRATAAEVFGTQLEDVTDDQRRSAKAINFGLIYGMSAFGLGQQLNIDRPSAQEFINLYFERYPGVKTFMDTTREQAHEDKYVETVFGRRLYLPEINANNHTRRQYAERTAINAPMQGTAADLIKLAMLAVDRWLIDEKIDARIIMQVHDELVLEAAEDAVKKVSKKLPELMAAVAELSVPLVADTGVGENWSTAHS